MTDHGGIVHEPRPPKRPGILARHLELLKVKAAARKKMLDESYPIVEEYRETDQERFDRISNDGTAWTDLGQ